MNKNSWSNKSFDRSATLNTEDDDVGNQEVVGGDPCGRRPLKVGVVPQGTRSKPATTAKCATTEHNWQANYKSVVERNTVMFNSEFMADVHFTVGTAPNKLHIPAHKYVLATGSSVFYAMFYGGLAHAASEIDIPDVEPSAFLSLLRYLYCDEVNLETDTVLSMLYAAKKYIVPHLACQCVAFLETSLSARNACVLLSQSHLFEEHELTQRCWEVIDAQTEEALASDGFTEIDHSTLQVIMARDTLNANEKLLFASAIDWAHAECMRRGITTTAENKRRVLANVLYLLRLPTMNVTDYANGPAKSGILTLQEAHDLFLYFTADEKPPLPFPIVARRGLQSQRCCRFQSSAYRSNQWRYRGRCDSIQFSVNRRIFIAGLGLYGSNNGASEYLVKIELKRSGATLGQCQTKFFSDGSSSTFGVYFDHPVQIEANTFYTASATLEGEELSFFGQEGLTEVNVGKVNFQFQCSSDSTNGTGVQGGQMPEVIFYAS